MVDLTAHCIKCGEDLGVKAVHFDGISFVIFVKMDCGHSYKISAKFRIMSRKETEEVFGIDKEYLEMLHKAIRS